MRLPLLPSLALALTLSGCSTTPLPVAKTCPEPPAHLLQRPGQLKPVQSVPPSLAITPPRESVSTNSTP